MSEQRIPLPMIDAARLQAHKAMRSSLKRMGPAEKTETALAFCLGFAAFAEAIEMDPRAAATMMGIAFDALRSNPARVVQ